MPYLSVCSALVVVVMFVLVVEVVVGKIRSTIIAITFTRGDFYGKDSLYEWTSTTKDAEMN